MQINLTFWSLTGIITGYAHAGSFWHNIVRVKRKKFLLNNRQFF